MLIYDANVSNDQRIFQVFRFIEMKPNEYSFFSVLVLLISRYDRQSMVTTNTYWMSDIYAIPNCNLCLRESKIYAMQNRRQRCYSVKIGSVERNNTFDGPDNAFDKNRASESSYH